jgi:peptidyl-prolyl cis-trans isomerase SurA
MPLVVRAPVCAAILFTTTVAFASASIARATAAPPDARVAAIPATAIAAVVEDRVITEAEILREIPPDVPPGVDLQTIKDQALQAKIDQVLIVKEFYSGSNRRAAIPAHYIDGEIKERIVTQFDNDRSRFLAYLRSIGKTEREFRQIVTEEMIVGYMRGEKRKSQAVVSPQKIENYYTQNRDRFYQPDGVHLRMIKLSRVADESQAVLNQTAETIMQKLRAGGDFATLAREYSQESSRSKGGDWGWIARNDLSEQFAGVAFALDAGQYSEPTQVGKDIFILYVEEKRLAGIQPLEEVRDQIERTLVTQMARETQDRWLERLRRNAYVRYFN